MPQSEAERNVVVYATHENWMTTLRNQLSAADAIIVKGFMPTSAHVRFLKAVTTGNSFFVRSFGHDLVLEKLAM